MQKKADTERNPEVLAIDIGGTFVKMGLVGSKGDIREVKVLNSQANDPYSVFEKRFH